MFLAHSVFSSRLLRRFYFAIIKSSVHILFIQWYVYVHCMLHVTCVTLSFHTVKSYFVCVCVSVKQSVSVCVCAYINLFHNFAFTRISLFTVIGYYLFTRESAFTSPLDFLRLIFIFTLRYKDEERERDKEWEAVWPNKVLFSTFHKIKRFGNVYKLDKIETVLSPEISV